MRNDPDIISTITQESFRKLVSRYGPELRRYCRRMTNNSGELADEILQLSFQAVWSQRASYQGGNPRKWLYEITRRQTLYCLRRESRYQALAPDALHALLDKEAPTDEREASPDPETRQQLRICFERLQPEDAMIVQLAYGLWGKNESPDTRKSLTYQEIGEGVGRRFHKTFSPDRVRMRLKRTLARMEQCLRRSRLLHNESTR